MGVGVGVIQGWGIREGTGKGNKVAEKGTQQRVYRHASRQAGGQAAYKGRQAGSKVAGSKQKVPRWHKAGRQVQQVGGGSQIRYGEARMLAGNGG